MGNGRLDTRCSDESGATAAEYAIMVALIAMVIFGAVALLGSTLFDSYECTGEHVSELTGDPASVTC